MMPSLEVEGLKGKVDTIVDYYGEEDKAVDEQAKKVKLEIDKLSELMER